MWVDTSWCRAPSPMPMGLVSTLGAPMAREEQPAAAPGLPGLSARRGKPAAHSSSSSSLKPPAQLQRGTQGSLWRTSPEASFPLEPSRSSLPLQPLPAQIASAPPTPSFLTLSSDPGAGCPAVGQHERSPTTKPWEAQERTCEQAQQAGLRGWGGRGSLWLVHGPSTEASGSPPSLARSKTAPNQSARGGRWAPCSGTHRTARRAQLCQVHLLAQIGGQ